MKITFDGGEHTSEDRTAVREGGLIRSVGAYYKPQDKRVHKVPGRTTFADTGAAARAKGLQLASFDDETDKVLCYAGTVVYASDAGATGTFSAAKTGLNAAGTYMVWAHADDKWFGVNGIDPNVCFEYADTGAGMVFGARNAGMIAPAQPPVATPDAKAGTVVRPTAVLTNTGSWQAPTECFDADDATFAYLLGELGDTSRVMTVGTIADDGGTTNREAIVSWRATDQRGEMSTLEAISAGNFEIQYRFKAEFYDQGTAAWVELCNERISESHATVRTSRVPISDACDIDNASTMFRFTLTRLSAWSRNIQLEIHDCRVQDDPAGAHISGLLGGFFYVYTEWDENRILESGPSAASNRVLLPDGVYNAVDVSNLAATPRNSTTTHYKIYRSYDDEYEDTDNPPTNTSLDKYGLVDIVPVGTEAYSDELDKSPRYALPEQLKIVGVTDGVTWNWYVRDNPPPVGEYIIAYRGTLVVSSGRSLHFLVPGRPESYVHDVSVVSSFPFEEHDSIVCMQTTGESLFVLASGIVAVMDDIPNVTNGAARIPEIRTIKGQPGCVSRLGATAYSVSGEKRVAWVSRHGIHASDGDQAINLVDDIDWAANVDVDNLGTCTLDWDASKQALIFGYDSDGGGTNDRHAYIHVFDPKRSTWGHYGTIASFSAGETGGVNRVYTGNETGVVYLEGGDSDASNSFDGSGNVRFDIETGRIYAENEGNERVYHLQLCKLLHTDGGVGEAVTVTVTAGYDADDDTHSESFTVSIDGQGGTEFLVDLAGEWFTFRVQHTGQADFGLSEIRGVARLMGRSGTVNA